MKTIYAQLTHLFIAIQRNLKIPGLLINIRQIFALKVMTDT